MKSLLFIVFFTGIALLKLNATYTFTSVDGRTLDAEIIAATEDTVTIRRCSDRRVFTINTARLIPADAVVIEKWLSAKQRAGKEPASNRKSIGKWPRKVKPRNYSIEIVREDSATDTYIYRTPHFEFRSNVKLARKVVREFSQIFESTLLAVAELPLNFDPEFPEDTHFITQIFETEEQYISAGGIPNSAGVYFSEDRKIMVPLRHLGVEKSSSAYTIDESKEINVLAHEITHQVTHDWLGKLHMWASEGIAEYIEHAPYKRGAFRFDKYDIEEVRRRGYTRLTGLETLMSMDRNSWNHTLSTDFKATASNYLSAFVLYYYFCHFELDDAGEPRLLYDYLRAIESGESREAATGILLNGRSYEELENTVKKSFAREDVTIGFL